MNEELLENVCDYFKLIWLFLTVLSGTLLVCWDYLNIPDFLKPACYVFVGYFILYTTIELIMTTSYRLRD